MNNYYDIVLKEVPGEGGLTRNDVADLFDLLKEPEGIPVEFPAKEHECSAMGFMTSFAGSTLEWNMGGISEFISSILDDMNNERDDCTYMFHDLRIWLSR